uniref:EF-hand domain-containing protein n=1 Tax=Calcidiscus leptoporus TaxID=127549 RepID=A0A7S0P749_9EUKA
MESLWSALDKDKSGFVTMQEFGAFMKRGQPEKGPTWKERLQNEQDEKGRQARLEKQTTSGRFISTVEPASAEELQQLSVLLREQLEDPKMWSAVFRKAASDGSGNITFDEFSGVVRQDLKLKKSTLPDAQLQRLWRSLDVDSSGFVVMQEIGLFLETGLACD